MKHNNYPLSLITITNNYQPSLSTITSDYSTTQLCYKLVDDKYLDKNGKIKEEYKFKLNFPEFGIVNSKISAKEDEKFDTLLFLPEGEGRKGEGGLRMKGYFKFSYERVIVNIDSGSVGVRVDSDSKEVDGDSEWWIMGSSGKKIKKVYFPTNNYQPSTITINYHSQLSLSTITNNYPLITIITVVYNGEKYLEETIKSVINQTYPNVEYIIIDGGSTDGTLDIIKKYEDKIDYWVSEKDEGIYDAMNKGIDVASDNSYLLFLNAGDTFCDNNILKKVTENLKEDTKIIYGSAKIFNENNSFLTDLKPLNFTKSNLNRFSTRVVCHQSIFVHKSIICKYNLNYRLKAELNWFYDIEKLILDKKQIVKLDFAISNYLLGGEGDINFIENNFERIKVTYYQNNIFNFIMIIPFFIIPFIFRLKRKILGK